MEKQIYGNITNTARTQFQFDKIYPNKMEMDKFCDFDGIYAGRYVLIEYDENPTRNAIKLIQSGINFFYPNGVQVIPNGTEENLPNIAPGVLCYVEKNGSYIFYKTQNKDDNPFEYMYEYSPKDNKYDTNWNIDYSKYKRGFDSTVWQKIYQNGKEEYIMIAELNAEVPTFTMTLDAPSEISEAPYFDEQSSDLNYNLHMPAQWDFRVKAAENGNSDEQTTHIIKYDESGNLLEEPIKKEVPADIFYNKNAFYPYYYDLIEFSENAKEWGEDKYYYKVKAYVRCDKDRNELNNFNNITFYEKTNGNDKEKYYLFTESSDDFEEVNLLKSTEINWKPETYYVISSTTFERVSEGQEFDQNKAYFIVRESQDGTLYYDLVSLDKTIYDQNPTSYFIATQVYTLDDSDSFSDATIYYYYKDENDKTPTQIKLYNKPEYVSGEYYTLEDEYLIQDTGDKYDPNKTYYDEKGEEINSSLKKYKPGFYYYIEDGQYKIEQENEPTEGREYYNKIIPSVLEGEDHITILPTGSSGRLYNNHTGNGEIKKDIQEISINFPSIGRMMAEIWNLVYGEERNELIYNSPVYDPNMYDSKSKKPLYQTGIEDLNNFIAIVNQINDLIGHNMIKIKNENSIGIDGKKVLIDGKELNYLTVDNAENFIYWVENENENLFYRIRIDGTNCTLISMNSIGTGIDTIYQALLEIQKALGTNEDSSNASSQSLKGVLFKLQQIIEDLNKGIDFVTVGEGLSSEKTIAWRSIYGDPLYREWNNQTFIAAKVYKDDPDYNNEKYFSNKYLLPYKRSTVEANETDYQNYYIEFNDIYIKPGDFNQSLTYYNFIPYLGNDISTDHPFKNSDSDYKYLNVLPKFFTYNEDGTKNYPENLNIFEDIIEYYLYTIIHDDPKPSNNNTTYGLSNIEIEVGTEEKEEKLTFSALNEIKVNKKGHIYPPTDTDQGLLPLPQAVIVYEDDDLNAFNLPIGTLIYVLDKVRRPWPGDVNADGDINIFDLLLLRQHLAGMDVDINETTADLNGDRNITKEEDLPLLREKIAVTLKGDVNEDGKVNGEDLEILEKSLSTPPSEDEIFNEYNADIDGNGTVNALDAHRLAALLDKKEETV